MMIVGVLVGVVGCIALILTALDNKNGASMTALRMTFGETPWWGFAIFVLSVSFLIWSGYDISARNEEYRADKERKSREMSEKCVALGGIVRPSVSQYRPAGKHQAPTAYTDYSLYGGCDFPPKK